LNTVVAVFVAVFVTPLAGLRKNNSTDFHFTKFNGKVTHWQRKKLL